MSYKSAIILFAVGSGLIAVFLMVNLCMAILQGAPGQYIVGGMILTGEPLTSEPFYIYLSIESVPEGWVLPPPGNTGNETVILEIESNETWMLSVSSNPAGGHMTEYCSSTEEYGSRSLTNAMVVSCAAWERSLQDGGVILIGHSTLDYPNKEQIVIVNLKQEVTWGDVFLEGDCWYQIDVIFQGGAAGY